MAEKKISDLTGKENINNDDELVFVDKATTSGTDAGVGGQTSKIKFSDLKTAVGTSGPQGSQGATGAQGATGPQGAKGNDSTVAGPQGLQGAKGNNSTVAGPQGLQGARGNNSTVAGPQGKQGARGNNSTVAGPQGARGPQGAVGASGSPWGGGTFTGATRFNQPLTLSTVSTGSVTPGDTNNTKLYVDESGSLNFRENASSGYTRMHIENSNHDGNGASFAISIHDNNKDQFWSQNPRMVMQIQPKANPNGIRGVISVHDRGTSTISFGNSTHFYMEIAGRGFHRGSHFYPQDGYGMVSLGKDDAMNRWSTAFLNTQPVVSSDRRLKSNIRELSEVEKSVAKKLKSLVRIYQKNDSIEQKGEENARLHCGVIAQDVKKAFEEEGLDGFRYSILCFDKYYVGKDEDGNRLSISEPKEGFVEETTYSIRYEQLLAFIISAI